MSAVTTSTSSEEPDISIVVITPTIAQEWLQKNEGNRPIQMHTVENYARLMQEGKWELNGDTIRFDNEGILRDGQHRLAAGLRAGVPFTSFVVRGIKAHSQATMDQGRKRSANDVLGMNGIVNGAAIASTARFVHQWKSGTRLIGDFKNSGRNQLSASEVLDWATQDELLGKANQVAGRTGMRAICNPRASSTLYYLCYQADPERCEVFFEALETGAGLKLGDPALTLRNHWQNLRMQGSKAPAPKYFSAGVRAWNKFCKGHTLSLISQRAERDVPDLFVPPGREDIANRYVAEPVTELPEPSVEEPKPKPRTTKKKPPEDEGGTGALFSAR